MWFSIVALDFDGVMCILVYMITTQNITKWGNSAGLRIPQKVLKAAKFSDNQEVELSVMGNTIVLTPVANTVDNLENLLSGIDATNLHSEIMTDAPQGNEVW